MRAEGTNGSVELLDGQIVIRRKGLANVLTQGVQGDKTVPLSSITAVQFRPAGAIMAGLIQFTLRGGREFSGGMLEATKDENAVMFDRSQEAAFALLRDRVQDAIVISSTDPTETPAEQLTQLAALVDQGFVTREEFEEAKRSILGDARRAAVNKPAAPTLTPTSRSRPAASLPINTDHRLNKGWMIAGISIVVILIFLASIGPKGPVLAEGAGWKVVGGLDDGAAYKFVEIEQTSSKDGAVYRDAASKLCGAGECVQIGFFLPGDQVPPTTSRGTFFSNGGWVGYAPAAVFDGKDFVTWNCEKAGDDGAPLSALCGDGVSEQYDAVLALAARDGWVKGCGLSEVNGRAVLDRFVAKLPAERGRQFVEAYEQNLLSSQDGPDTKSDCEALRSRIDLGAREARKTLSEQ
jgi:hypothetical protein